MLIEYKGFQIKNHKEFAPMFIIATAGKGGKIPDVLSGYYTSAGIAQREIDKYLDSKPIKESKNAKAGTES